MFIGDKPLLFILTIVVLEVCTWVISIGLMQRKSTPVTRGGLFTLITRRMSYGIPILALTPANIAGTLTVTSVILFTLITPPLTIRYMGQMTDLLKARILRTFKGVMQLGFLLITTTVLYNVDKGYVVEIVPLSIITFSLLITLLTIPIEDILDKYIRVLTHIRGKSCISQ